MTQAIQKKRRQYRAAIAGEGKASYQKKYDKAMSGRDPRAAIAAKCLDCMYWQRSRITECPIVCCPLWPYRPFTSPKSLEPPAPPQKSGKPRRPKASTSRRSPHAGAKRSTRKRK
jgi:hypothetical protein